MDGTPTLRMNEFILASLANGKVDLGPTLSPSASSDLPAPTELVFNTDSKVYTLIQQAEKNFDELVSKHDLQVRFLAHPLINTNTNPFLGPALRRLRQGVHQGVPGVARRMGTDGQAARVPQDVRPPWRVLRECADTQVPARSYGGYPLREQREQGVGGCDARPYSDCTSLFPSGQTLIFVFDIGVADIV